MEPRSALADRAALAVGLAKIDVSKTQIVSQRLALSPMKDDVLIEIGDLFLELAGLGGEPMPTHDPLLSMETGTSSVGITESKWVPRLRDWAIEQIEENLSANLERFPGGEQTYRTPSGKVIHLRTMKRYDRGEGRYSYWFGLRLEKWQPGEYFVLACDTDGIMIVPVDEWLSLMEVIPKAKNGSELQPNVWKLGEHYELRVKGGTPIEVTEWVGRFDLLA